MDQQDQLKLAHETMAEFRAQSHAIEEVFTFLAGNIENWFTHVQQFSKKDFASDCMLVVTELAEATEGNRKPGPSEHVPEFTKEEEEIADAIVRCFHMSGKYNLRIGEAFIAKMGYNFTRPLRHGKAY